MTAREPGLRTLWCMVGVQFIMSMALSVASPILPLFLPEIGVQPGGPVEFWAGLLASLNAFVAAFASPVWGSVADRYGRKAMVLRSSLAICFFTLLMGLSTHLWQLVALRACMGAFSGFSASAIALVATQVREERLGFALGWLSTGQLIGGLVGPVVGGTVADVTGQYRMVFFCTAAFAAAAATAAYLGVREERAPRATKTKQPIWQSFAALARTRGLLPLFLVLLIAQFGVRTVQPVVTLFVQDLVGWEPGLATLAGFAFSVTGIADLIASPFLGKRSDVLGYRRVLLISLFGAAMMSLPQSLVGAYWQFLALRFGVGLFVGGILPTANALVGRLVPASQRGLAYGLTASATFLGSSMGPFTGGTVAALAGIRWVFVLTGTLFLVNLVWVWRVVPDLRAGDAPARASEATGD
ncbi:MFS transporter [Roseomonas elaeocarpi]|uniref:MFS transporter n=1 Tax=Roseomonas elaeocarpi TaxID=907779 RepID=A0ABV6JPI9_9PROT